MRFPLGPGDEGPVIVEVQKRLGVFPSSGVFDDRLLARVRGWQLSSGEPVDGLIYQSTLQGLGVDPS